MTEKNYVKKINTSTMINTDLQESNQIRFIQSDCGTINSEKSQEIQIPNDRPNQTSFDIKVPKH